MNRRVRRFFLTVLAATLSIAAIAQPGQAYGRYNSAPRVMIEPAPAINYQSQSNERSYRPSGDSFSGNTTQNQDQSIFASLERDRLSRSQPQQAAPRVQMQADRQVAEFQPPISQQPGRSLFEELERSRMNVQQQYSQQPQQPPQTYQATPEAAPPVNQPYNQNLPPVNGGSPEVRSRIIQELAAMPLSLRNKIGKVQINDQLHPTNPGNVAATANGVNRTIDVWGGGKHYPGNKEMRKNTTWHEAGHLMAFEQSKGASYEPPSEYMEILRRNGPVSEYGANDGVEDYADAFRLYADGTLESKDPERYAYIQRVLGGS